MLGDLLFLKGDRGRVDPGETETEGMELGVDGGKKNWGQSVTHPAGSH